MNKLLITAILTSGLIATNSSALANSFSNNKCQVELEAGLRINTNSIEFLNDSNDSLYKILNDKTLVVDGDIIALNSTAQALVTEYSISIRAVVPEIRSIAIDGVDLAIDGVNLAFNELLGEGNDISTDLTHELSKLRDEVGNRLSIEEGIYINADGLESEGIVGKDILGEDFENRIEEIVESAVMSSMGSLLVAVGQEMMFSGGSMDAFEARMEAFGENIENEMESRAEKFEQRAEDICYSVVQIDNLEEQLKSEVDALNDINVISAEFDKNKTSNAI